MEFSTILIFTGVALIIASFVHIISTKKEDVTEAGNALDANNILENLGWEATHSVPQELIPEEKEDECALQV